MKFIGIEKRATGIQLSTARFAELLRYAAAWDSHYKAMCHAQQGWLTENFVFGDHRCTLTPVELRRQWDIPRVVGGKLFTRYT